MMLMMMLMVVVVVMAAIVRLYVNDTKRVELVGKLKMEKFATLVLFQKERNNFPEFSV